MWLSKDPLNVLSGFCLLQISNLLLELDGESLTDA